MPNDKEPKNNSKIVNQKMHSFEYSQNADYAPKHITVDLAGQETENIGAAMSSRQALEVEDERGKKITGFFTRDEDANVESYFSNRMRQAKIPAGYEHLNSVRDKVLKNGLDDLADAITENFGIDYNKIEMGTADGIFDSNYSLIQSTIREHYSLPDDTFRIKTGPNRSDDDIAVHGFVKSLVFESIKALKINAQRIDSQKLSADGNVNRRNNATSDYAGLLKQQKLIAKSYPMTIKNGNEVIHGSFMETAEGLPMEKLHRNTAGFSGKKLVVSGSGFKDTCTMQAFDILCANVDRHAGNMFYTVDTKDPKTVKITGIQGIDHDSSFGNISGDLLQNNRTYGLMSGLEDLHYIDAGVADSILELTQETLENKLRLSGLSAEELQAAGERLRLMQEKLTEAKKPAAKNGQEKHAGLTIIQSDAEWETLVNDNPDLISKLAYGDMEEGNANIFKYINEIVKNYNDALLDEEAPPEENAGPLGPIPSVKAVNTEDFYNLDYHLQFLEKARETLDKNRSAENPEENFERKVGQLLDKTIHTMRYVKEHHFDKNFDDTFTIKTSNEEIISDRILWKQDGTLTDVERAAIVDDLAELQKAAAKYVEKEKNKQPKDPAEKDKKAALLNTAKDLREYTDFAHAAMKNSATEADLIGASTVVNDLLEKNKLAKTPFTFEKLSERTKGIAGRCTHFYTDMMTAFEGKGDLSKAANDKERLRWCKEMIKGAQGYLKHKVPDARAEKKLNQKERARVQFARDLEQYAKAQQTLYRKILGETSTSPKQIANDYQKMFDFRKKCNDLYQSYNKADGFSEEYDAITKKLLSSQMKKEYAEGFKNILAISEKYPPDHKMQIACANMIEGLHNFNEAVLGCYNYENGVHETSIYKVLGMTDKDYGALAKATIGKGKNIVDTMIAEGEAAEKEELQKAQMQNEKTEEPIVGGMEEVNRY